MKMKPKSEAELSEAIAGAEGALAIRGGGTRPGRVPGAVLDVSGLSGIKLYEPGALTLVAGAGTPLSEIKAVLDAENQRLAFEPMDHRGLLGTSGSPTIGGTVAANVSGPRRVQAGACRDHVLGVRFVDGLGRAVKNGGRVMKNVTGYDLARLLCGSWGTLGVISEVALKVLPRAETEATLAVTTAGLGVATQALSRALGSPFDVTGAAFEPEKARVLIRLEGFAESVAYRAARLCTGLSACGHTEILAEGAESAAIWRAIRDVEMFRDRPGDVWRVSVRPGDAAAIAERLEAEGMLVDWGGGLIWALVAEGTDLRAGLGTMGGHATLVRARPETLARHGMFHPEPAANAALCRGLRAKFDPRGILNAGLMDHPVEA